MSALDQIRKKFPQAAMIPLADAAAFLAKTPEAAYKAAIRGGMPGNPKKVGGIWMVNVEALAEFIDTPGEETEQASHQSRKVGRPLPKPKASAGRETDKTVRPPSLAQALLAMKKRLETTAGELEFQNLIFAELEIEDL
jgi:hypothetical protein